MLKQHSLISLVLNLSVYNLIVGPMMTICCYIYPANIIFNLFPILEPFSNIKTPHYWAYLGRPRYIGPRIYDRVPLASVVICLCILWNERNAKVLFINRLLYFWFHLSNSGSNKIFTFMMGSLNLTKMLGPFYTNGRFEAVSSARNFLTFFILRL